MQSAPHRLNRYPDMGALALRERLAGHLAATSDEVAVGPGSVGVLQQIIVSICDRGGEVVLAWRSFEAYPIVVALAGAVPVHVPLSSGEGHDIDRMAGAVTPRTRLALLRTPNNPTGVPIGHEGLESFLGSVPQDVLVVIDGPTLTTPSGQATQTRWLSFANTRTCASCGPSARRMVSPALG